MCAGSGATACSAPLRRSQSLSSPDDAASATPTAPPIAASRAYFVLTVFFFGFLISLFWVFLPFAMISPRFHFRCGSAALLPAQPRIGTAFR